VARYQERGQLGPNGRLGVGCVLARSGALDDLHRKVSADVTGDQHLLDRTPICLCGPALKQAAEPRHEAATGAFQTGLEIAGRLVGDFRLDAFGREFDRPVGRLIDFPDGRLIGRRLSW